MPAALPGQEPLRLSLQQWMELYKIPGLSVAVFDKNTLLWAKTVAVDTLFPIGKTDGLIRDYLSTR